MHVEKWATIKSRFGNVISIVGDEADLNMNSIEAIGEQINAEIQVESLREWSDDE